VPAGPAAQVVGNRRTLVYHRPDCPNAARIPGRTRVAFDPEASAAAAGYRPGRDYYR
jgi:methylphosphotriester-DNA--protein-cysteine methyltransferase